MFNALQSFQALEMGQDRRKERDRESAMKGIGNALAGGDISGATAQAFQVDPMYGMQIQQYGDTRNALATRKSVGAKLGAKDYAGGMQDAFAEGDLEMGSQIMSMMTQMDDQARQKFAHTIQETASVAGALLGIPENQRRGYLESNPQLRQRLEMAGIPFDQALSSPMDDQSLQAQMKMGMTAGEMLQDQRWQAGHELDREQLDWQQETDRRDFGQKAYDSNRSYGLDERRVRLLEQEAETEAETAMQPVPGFPAPATRIDGLPAGVVGTYARSDEKALEAAREAAAESRSRATLTSQFVDKAKGFGAQGKGVFNDIGQALSMKTSGLEQITSKLGPSSRPEGSGSTSDKDMSVYMQSTVNVDNTKGTNQDVAAMENALADRDEAYLQWMQDYTAAYPVPGSTRDAKRLWDQYANADENSLFSVDKNGRVVVAQPRPITDWLSNLSGGQSDGDPPPEGIDPVDWGYLTAEERALFKSQSTFKNGIRF